MIWVHEAKYLQNYEIWIKFNNNVEGILDLKEFVFSDTREIFTQLQDKDVFLDFIVDMDTIVWNNGADLAPEFLYESVLKNRDTIVQHESVLA